VDGWDFKQYVLGMLFYRYISENLAGYINVGEREAGDTAFDYAKLPYQEAEQAREDLVATKGFFILPSELFDNVRRLAANDENLNETLGKIYKNIEASDRQPFSKSHDGWPYRKEQFIKNVAFLFNQAYQAGKGSLPGRRFRRHQCASINGGNPRQRGIPDSTIWIQGDALM